jgi:dihydrofolate reductase
MTISIIVAASINNCIGKQNKLPWHLKSDLQYFKKLTTNHCIIMGRNTFESIGKPLPNRVNIVLTTDRNFTANGIVVRHQLQDALDYAKKWNMQEVFIIGGATVYEQSMEIANKIYLTKVDTIVENGDAFLPELDTKKWTLQQAIGVNKNQDNDHNHIFETYIPTNAEPIIYR